MQDEIDPPGTKLLQRQNQLFQTPGEAIKPEDHDHLEGAAPGISHEGIQDWPAFRSTTRPVGVDLVKRPCSLGDQIAEWLFLHSGILIVANRLAVARLSGRGDSNVDGGAARDAASILLVRHRRSPLGEPQRGCQIFAEVFCSISAPFTGALEQAAENRGDCIALD